MLLDTMKNCWRLCLTLCFVYLFKEAVDASDFGPRREEPLSRFGGAHSVRGAVRGHVRGGASWPGEDYYVVNRQTPLANQANSRNLEQIADEDQIDDWLKRGSAGGVSRADIRVEPRAHSRQVASLVQQQGQDGTPRQLAVVHAANADDSTETQAFSGAYFIALVAGCSAATVCGVIAAGFCWYKFQKNAKAAAEAEYPAYGVTGPNKDHVSPSTGGDRKLAHSAQMYHYQHQKQQMIAMEKSNGERQVSTSDLDSEDENEEGDYTVYECPGLAQTGEMEVKNPLFQDDSSVPSSPPVLTKTGDIPRSEAAGF